MALRLACSEGSRFAAYGIIGSAQAIDCKPSPPRVSLFSGTSADEARKPVSAAGSAAGGASIANVTDPAASLARKLGCGALTQTTQSGKVSKAKWSGCNSGVEIEVTRALERVPVDRAAPELWGFFRKFGG